MKPWVSFCKQDQKIYRWLFCCSSESESRSFFFLFQFALMAASLQTRGFISFGKRFLQTKNSISVFRGSSPLVSDTASRSRHFYVTPYDKNVDDGLCPSLVPDDVVEQHMDKFWAPHPQTGVFGPSKEIGSENQTQPPPPNLDNDADAADGSVLDQKARFRPLEDVDKPIINLE